MESGSICFSTLECSDREVQSQVLRPFSGKKQDLCLVEITGQVYKAIVNQHLPGLAGTLRAVPPPTIKSLSYFSAQPSVGATPRYEPRGPAGGRWVAFSQSCLAREYKLFTLAQKSLGTTVSQGAFSPPLI